MENRNSIRWQSVIFICSTIFLSFLAFFVIVRHVLIDDYRQITLKNDLQLTQIISHNINHIIKDSVRDKVINDKFDISPVHYMINNQDVVFSFVKDDVIINDVSLFNVIEFINNFNKENAAFIHLIDSNGKSIAQPHIFGEGIFDYYNMTCTSFQRDDKGYVVKDKDGKIILNERPFEISQGFVDIIHNAVEGKSGSTSFRNDKTGKVYFCIYQPLELPFTDKTWSIILVNSSIDMMMTVDGLFRNAILGGFIILLIATYTLMYFSEKMTEPIFKMVEMANRVRAGDLSGQLNIKANNEIGLLADNINHMIQGLRIARQKSRENENQIKAIAYRDTLTGMPNRIHFMIFLRDLLGKSVQGRLYGALLFVDVDKFKSVNDTYGHAVGDGLLIEFSERIVEVIGRKEIACRYGGDEFLLFLPCYNYEDAKSTCELLVKKMREPFNIYGNECHLSTSIGAAMFPTDAENIDELMEKADAALYVSKRNGRDQYNFYKKGMVTVDKD